MLDSLGCLYRSPSYGGGSKKLRDIQNGLWRLENVDHQEPSMSHKIGRIKLYIE